MTFRAGSSRLRRGLKVAGAYVPPPLSAPSNVSAPVISGSPYVGSTLTTSTGAWNGYPAPTFAYQWKSGATNVGTNSNTYAPVSGDLGNVITVAVSATNSQGGPITATSAGTAAITSAPTTPIDVALFMGQSNAVGYQTDQTSPYAIDSEVLVFDGTSLVTYQPGVVTGLEFGASTPKWAAELQYAHDYRAANPSKKLAILKYTAGGTTLAVDWNVSSGSTYPGAVTYFANAIAALVAAGYSPTVRFVDWMQGESDAGDLSMQSAYETNLTNLVAALRDPSGAWKIPATAPFAIGRIRGADAIRTAEANVAAADVGGPQWMYDTDDLPLESDNLHYTKAGQITRGDRLWAVDQGTYTLPAAPDTTPDAFSFTDITGATLSTDYTSNTITVAGINTATAISISGGTYSKNGGSFTSSSGTVVNGDTVAVKVTSSGSNSTAVSATLTIGGVSDTYSVTTQAAAASYTTLSETPQYTTTTPTYSNGDLTFASDGSSTARSLAAIPAGSHYFEMRRDNLSSGFLGVGVCPATGTGALGFNDHSISYFQHGAIYQDGGGAGSGGGFADGDVIGVKVVHDGSTGSITFIDNGGASTSSLALDSLLAGGAIYAAVGIFSSPGAQATMNFGATSYAHGLPSGFSSIPG